MSDVRIVEAAGDDVAAIAAFFWEAWAMTGPGAPGWAGAHEDAMAELTDPALLLERVGGPERRMFLAWDGDRVVGFSATRRRGSEAELAGIVVREDRTGEGLGGPLLDAAVSSLVETGVEAVTVKTEADNERALGFYEHHGFVRTGLVTEDVEGAAVDLCKLRLDVG